jgi:hypothetical protein
VRRSDFLISFAPKLGVWVFIFASLSPILLIAFVHHWLHQFMDTYYPNTQSPEMSGTQGFFPGLMSWWEGLYGWLVISLAGLLSSIILVIFLPPPNVLSDLRYFWTQTVNLFSVSTLLRLVISAYLYQFEYLVRQHLMTVGSAPQSNQQ